jgi:hypothetical protein
MALDVKLGTYTGTGGTSGTRAITGIGFQPKAVFVWNDSTTQTIVPTFAFQSAITGLGSCMSWLGENGWVTATTADRFQSFDSDGFTISIGSSTTNGNKALNGNSLNFFYLALGGSDIVSGSYAGDNADNRDITGIGFQPIWVMLAGGNQHQQMKFDSSGASTDTFSRFYAVSNSTNGIQALISDGFQVGSDIGANSTTRTFYYIAVAANANTYQSEYTGNGTDDRDITGVGFTPNFVLIKSEGAHGFALRSSDHSGDLSKFFQSSGFAANYIQSLSSDGFQVGTAVNVNNNTSVMGFIAFREGAAGVNTTNFFFLA